MHDFENNSEQNFFYPLSPSIIYYMCMSYESLQLNYIIDFKLKISKNLQRFYNFRIELQIFTVFKSNLQIKFKRYKNGVMDMVHTHHLFYLILIIYIIH